jgi:hypothetical protein
VTSGSIDPIPGGGAYAAIPGFSFAVPASLGDFVELQLSFLANISAAFLDTAVQVGGALVRYAATGTAAVTPEGDPCLYAQPNTFRTSGYTFGFEVEAGDLSGGNVTAVLASKGAAAGKLSAEADYPLRWVFRNYGGGLT